MRSRMVARYWARPGAGVHHWGAPGVDGGDDLLRGDALQVRAGRGQVGVPQLALDQRQRDPLTQQLDDRNAGAHRLTVASAEAASGCAVGALSGGSLVWCMTRRTVWLGR